MSLLDKMREAHEAASAEMESLEIKELGEVIYRKPATLAERDKILKLANKQESSLALYVYALIILARNAAGEAIFELKDKPMLMNDVDAGLVVKMGEFVFAGALGNPGEEDNSKNS